VGFKVSKPKLSAPKANIAAPLKKAFGGSQPKTGGALKQATKGLTTSNAGNVFRSVTGQKARDNAESAKRRDAAAQDKKIKDAMDKRPAFKSAQSVDGSLKKAFKTADIKSNTKGLERRMDKAQEIEQTSAYKKALGAVDSVRREANDTRDSAWATARKGEARLLRDQANAAAAEDSGRGVATGMSRMMAQGGGDMGSRERMLMQANRQNMYQGQRNNAAYNSQVMGVSADDAAQKAQMRMGLASQYGGLDASEQNRLGANQSLNMNKANAWGNLAANEAQANQQASHQNAQMAFGNTTAQNQYNMGVYQEQMAAMGAAATADAQLKGPKQSGGIFDPYRYT
jgi:hypothetical protein